ncbi:MAG: ATP-binding cassette domain-containing protein [Myxococcota bacterium]
MNRVETTRSQVPALDLDVRLRLGEREFHFAFQGHAARVAITGPSGAGKSTVLRVLAGVEVRALGRVSVQGQSWQDSAAGLFLPPHRRRAALVPQDAQLFPHRSVRENLAWALPVSHVEELARVAALLGIEHLLDRRPRHLSGGERQRVALGRALLASPQVLLLDEPFAALDRATRSRLALVVRTECAARMLPVVLVSHDEADVDTVAEEVLPLVPSGSSA